MATPAHEIEQRALPLAEAAADPTSAGGKAARLVELLRAGFDVPDGVVIPAAVADRICRPGGEDAMRDALDRVIEALGEGPLAVRSSAVAEDLEGASFAGQYETHLDVRGRDAIERAIRDCRASVGSGRVAAYAGQQGRAHDGEAPIAVLVQGMVPADAAGVAFTADPVSGSRERVLVSAVRGLGERLVSGAASPDEWALEGDRATPRAQPERAIDEAQAREVAALARRVEAHYGSPQDIEWAIAGGRLYLLQARPITALGDAADAGVEVPVVAPAEGFWEREETHFPQPLSPMMRTTYLADQWDMTSKVFNDFGLLLEGIEQREIGGWVYTRAIPFGGKDDKPPPDFVFKILTWVIPSLRRRLQTCVRAVREGLAWDHLVRWEKEWRPAIIGENNELRAVDLPSLDDAALVAHLWRVRRHVVGAGTVHFDVSAPWSLAVGELALGLAERLGWDDGQVIALLSGTSEMSSEPARRLAEVAALASSRDPVRELLRDAARRDMAELRRVDPEVADAFDRYIDEFGCRALRYEIINPTLEESPSLMLRLLADQVESGYDPKHRAAALAAERQASADAARAALAGRTDDLAWFERALEAAIRAYPVREENEFHTVSMPFALLRYGVLELGRRLAERGVIDTRDDVMFVEWEEALAALEDGRSRSELVERRKRERTWVLGNPGPQSYGDPPGPPPSLAPLPPEARFATEVLFWEMERQFPPPLTDHEDGVLRGIAAAAGSYTGPARIVADESQFEKVQPGDVLVCPITSPVWSVLFASIGALVTESGGVLSHPAIIAREYRVPAVVAVGGAMQRLRDGDIVTVDGATGEVRLAGR
jgi:rifampicin phosphotransferase